MKKLKFILPFVAVVSLVAGLASPASAGTTEQHFRDINSPLDSCAYTTGQITNTYQIGVGWVQQFQDFAQWFKQDPGCAYGGGQPGVLAANTMRVKMDFQCSHDAGSTWTTPISTGYAYVVGGNGIVGQNAYWNPGLQPYCNGVTALVRLVVYGGYLIGNTWFNTSHTGAWT
jgi:hypothetical protein